MKFLLILLLLLFPAELLPAQTTPVVNLAWSLNDSAITGWKLEKKIGTSTYSQINQFPLATVTFTDTLTGDTGGITYCYRVRATYASSDGVYSSDACVTTPGGNSGPPSVFAISTVGVVTDTVGPTTPTPDGMKDVKVALTGLKSIPVSIKVSPSQGGYYEYPFNGSSWVPFLLNFNNGMADLFYTYPYNIPGLKNHIVIKYSDGTTAQADG